MRHGEPEREDGRGRGRRGRGPPVLGREVRGRGVVRGGAHAPALPWRLGVPEVRQPQVQPCGGQTEEAPVHALQAAVLRDLLDPDAGVAVAAADVVPGVPARRRLEEGRLGGRARARPGDERDHRALRGAQAPRRDVGRIGAPSAGSRARSRSATPSWALPPRGRWAGDHQAGAGLRRVARLTVGPGHVRGEGRPRRRGRGLLAPRRGARELVPQHEHGRTGSDEPGYRSTIRLLLRAKAGTLPSRASSIDTCCILAVDLIDIPCS